MRFQNKPYFYITIFIIIIISFLCYSSNFYPLLNSDDALNILMAHYYKLPNDLYCWGQDRGGTLIPFISQIFIRLFHLSALTSVSVSNYLLLVIGFFGFASLLKTNYSKILFCLIWFLPFQRFIDILRFPIGIEYSLIGFAIFLITKLQSEVSFNRVKSNLLLFAIVLILILSVWVSDLATVTIGVLLFILFVFGILKSKKISISRTVLFYVIFGLISCYLLITYAKSFAILKAEHYLSLNNIASIKTALKILGSKNIEVLTFQTNEILVSIYSYCVILFLIVFIAYTIKKKLFLVLISNKWFTFFISDFIIIFGTFLISSWVLSNEMGRWYFVASYISLSLAILLAIENLSRLYRIKYFKLALLLIVILGAISPIYTMKYVSPKTLRPIVDVVGEFEQLGEIGVIAEFWNAYIISCPDPEKIKATTHDQCYIRNQKLIDMVFERKNLYVIKDMWMKEFPDTLEQFGYVLLKDGNQFRLGGCDVCKYNKIKILKVLQLRKFQHDRSQLIFDNSLNRNVLFASSNCDTCKEKYFICSPNIHVGIGEFTAKFYLKASNFNNDKPIAMLDVSCDLGEIKLAETKITKTDFIDTNFTSIKLDFKTTKRVKNLEFRIYYYGNADLYFDHVELTEK